MDLVQRGCRAPLTVTECKKRRYISKHEPVLFPFLSKLAADIRPTRHLTIEHRPSHEVRADMFFSQSVIEVQSDSGNNDSSTPLCKAGYTG